MAARGYLLALALATLACKSGGDGSPSAEPGSKAGATKSPAATAKPTKRKPRGWTGYSGKRVTGTEGMGLAAGARLVDHDGQSFELASAWADGYAVLVFYRGHW